MSRFISALEDINKGLLLLAFISLCYKRGHFSGTMIPGPFQILFVISILLTIIYVLSNQKIKTFFLSIPIKIWLAIIGLFLSVIIGWGMAILYAGLPTTLSTIRDFGTFTISLIIFVLVLFYTNNDEKYAKWYLYVLFIPNLYILYYFLTHGIVGYWGSPSDNSLHGLVDPNVQSKVLLIPALFFISLLLFTLSNRKWWFSFLNILLSSGFVMLVFWTVSRGSALSLIFGSALIVILFSLKEFSWRRIIGSVLVVFFVLSFGYWMVPSGTKQELKTKISNTGSLPTSNRAQITEIVKKPSITMEEMRDVPRSEVRVLEWLFFVKYALYHPLGIGPSSSSFNYQEGEYLQLRPGNTYIQVWLWGGILGIICFLYILGYAFASAWTKWKNFYDIQSLSLIGILFALSISIIFDASLYFYWFFIILALAVRERKPKVNEILDQNVLVEKEKICSLNKQVSVIIPVYNTEKYIAKTIESVIRQTYQNIEIIIVNDGSTDGTKKIIQKYADKDKRIIIFEQVNKGLSAARNSGFKIARGDFFCIIDADDIMLPNKIESQVNFLEKHPEGDIVYSKVYYFMDEINRIYVRDLITETGASVYKQLLKQGNFISPNSVLFRRSVFEKFGGFNEDLYSSEDFDYWLYLSGKGVNFLHINKYLTLCRYREGSMTANSIKMYSSAVSVFEKYLLTSENKLLAGLTSLHYLKAKVLLTFSVLKKPTFPNKNNLNQKIIYLSLQHFFVFMFHFMRKIKFLLTFKEIKNREIQEFLNFIESHKV